MNKKLNNPKLLNLISMLYFGILVFSSLVIFKIIQTNYGVLSASSLMTPFCFIISDMIAEVYGFKESIKVFFYAILCDFILASIVFFLIKLPSPSTWQHQQSFDLIIGTLPRNCIIGSIANIFAWPINSFILTRWKILTQGRYFWLRSICCSGIGMLIFTLTVSVYLIGMDGQKYILSMFSWSLGLKLVTLCIFSFPANLAVFWIKKIENIDVYDNDYQFKNPFKSTSV